MKNQRKNPLMRGWVEAGINAARFDRVRAVILMLGLGVPAQVIRRVLP